MLQFNILVVDRGVLYLSMSKLLAQKLMLWLSYLCLKSCKLLGVREIMAAAWQGCVLNGPSVAKPGEVTPPTAASSPLCRSGALILVVRVRWNAS